MTDATAECQRQRCMYQGLAAALTTADSVLPNQRKGASFLPVRTCRTSRRRHRPPLDRIRADCYPSLTTRGRLTCDGVRGSAHPMVAPTRRDGVQKRGQDRRTTHAPLLDAQKESSSAATTDRSPTMADAPMPSRTPSRTTTGSNRREGAPTLNRQPHQVADGPAADSQVIAAVGRARAWIGPARTLALARTRTLG